MGRFGPIQWVPPPHSVFSVGQTELIREPHSPLSWLPPLLADPIAQVHQAFCKNLLERAVESLVKPQAKKKAADQEEESWYRPWICPPPPQATHLSSTDGALRSTSLKETSPSVATAGKSSDSLMLMSQAWQPHESPLWAQSWLLCLLLPHQVYHFPLFSFLPVSSLSGVSFWSRLGIWFFALPLGRGRVACGRKHGKLSRGRRLRPKHAGDPDLY